MISFQIIIGILVVLAITDLIVGVSNDAVNFLNSAVGSKAASFRTILIIASVGVVVGTLFSNGMMQIARNGIFQPEFFTFDKVMIIFLAVMLTDVILLDIYNTLGLPTSTTVSLIFELLGASFTIGVLFLLANGKPLAELENILNYKSAFIIIGGIFFSVLVAFASGTIIHFFTRFLFTFKLKKSLRIFGPAFTGISITIIVYFLLIKGLEGSTLANPAQLAWIDAHTVIILLISFAGITLITALLMRWQDFNPLRLIVLLGTFSLAMAFAGNDLVNFIGVSVAAYSSYTVWAGSQVNPDAFNMGVLNQQVNTPTWFLLSAGVVMVLTLWLSAKSRKVTETEVSLGRQEEGDEKFASSVFSRWLVGGAIFVGSRVTNQLPNQWKRLFEKRLKQPNERKKQREEPSFDLLRASVNLIVSSALIAYGTSHKLPLSTTFVTFMVAMGTSFADQAWGRESAVYRVSGVLQVISGWVLTALVAFAGSSLVALFLYFTGFGGVVVLSLGTFALLIYSQLQFKKKQGEKQQADQLIQKDSITVRELLDQSKLNTAENLQRIQRLLTLCFHSLMSETATDLSQKKADVKKVADENNRISGKIIKYIRKTEGGIEAGRLNLLVFDLLQDLYQSSLLISEVCHEHITNFHALPNQEFQRVLEKLDEKTRTYFGLLERRIHSLQFENPQEVLESYESLVQYLSTCLDVEVKRIQQNQLSNRLALLQTRILLEVTDVIDTSHRLYQLYHQFANEPKDESLLASSLRL